MEHLMFEYKVVPAPKRGLKGKGVKGNENKFAFALQTVMNELGKDSWEYLRTDTLPAEEREGLMGRTTVFQNMLVFRRTLAVQKEDAAVVAADETPMLEDQADEVLPEAEDVEVEVDETFSSETFELDDVERQQEAKANAD